MKEHWQTKRKRRNEYMRLYRLRDVEKNAARKAVFVAVRNGKLKKKPCEVCGELRVEAHHKSYALGAILDVSWLCKKHHTATHN